MDLFSRTIHEDSVKGVQLRITVNEFRDVTYLHIRKYFQDFEGTWQPTKEGVSMPLGLTNTLALFLALSEMLADTEIELVQEGLQEVISTYKGALDAQLSI